MIDIFAGIFALLICGGTGLALWRYSMGPASGRPACILRVLLVGLVVVPILLFATWRLSKSRDLQLCGTMVKRVDTSEPCVALTFDDGPTVEYTGEILEVLRDRDVKATFFLTGKEIERHMDEARRIVADGHELGNHSFSHQSMIACSTAFVRHEIEKTDQLIRDTGYQGTIHFRPPYCKRLLVLPLYLWRTGRTTVLFNIEPESFPEVAAAADRIVAHVVAETQPGSIILMHLMYPGRAETRKALPLVIDALRAQGYKFVKVSDLLDLRE